jgi:hypothetical protein
MTSRNTQATMIDRRLLLGQRACGVANVRQERVHAIGDPRGASIRARSAASPRLRWLVARDRGPLRSILIFMSFHNSGRDGRGPLWQDGEPCDM